jgi:hypothetical protein
MLLKHLRRDEVAALLDRRVGFVAQKEIRH